jgi:hypothetical protein
VQENQPCSPTSRARRLQKHPVRIHRGQSLTSSCRTTCRTHHRLVLLVLLLRPSRTSLLQRQTRSQSLLSSPSSAVVGQEAEESELCSMRVVAGGEGAHHRPSVRIGPFTTAAHSPLSAALKPSRPRLRSSLEIERLADASVSERVLWCSRSSTKFRRRGMSFGADFWRHRHAQPIDWAPASQWIHAGSRVAYRQRRISISRHQRAGTETLVRAGGPSPSQGRQH